MVKQLIDDDFGELYGDVQAEQTGSESAFSAASPEQLAQLIRNCSDCTDQEVSKKTLAHCRGLLRYVIEHTRSAVAIHDRDLRYIYVSQQYLDEFEVKERNVIGKHHYEVFPDLPRKWRDAHQKALAGEVASAEDDLYVREDGTVDWIRWECRPWYEADGSVGGIIVYIEIITERTQLERELIRRSEFERLISELSSEFVALSIDELDSGIDHALSRIGEFTGVDRAYVFRFRDGGKRMDNTHEWCRDGVESQIARLTGIDLHEELPWLAKGISAGETFRVPDVAALPPEAQLEREHFASQGIRSLICLPMTSGGALRGFLGFDSVREQRDWSDEDTTVLRLVGETLANALERAAAEKTLRNSRQEFGEIFTMSLDLICVADIGKATFLKVNPSFTRVLGYDEAELVNHPFSEFIHPDDIEPTRRVVEEKLQQGSKVVGFTNRYRCKDGTWRWLEWTSHPLPERGITFAVGHDVTECREMQEALAVESSFNNAVIDKAAEGLCVCHAIPEHPYVSFTRWNERMKSITGYSMEEINARGWYQTMYPDPENQRRAVERMSQMREGVDLVGEEWTITRSDGKKRTVLVSTSLLHTADGEAHVLALLQDISERKQLEERLRQTEKMEVIGQLAGGVAHDFNNQLGGIMNYADLLLSKTDDEELRSFIDGIIQSCTRSSELTNQLLAFSRKGQYQLVPLNIHEIMVQVTDMLGRSSDRRICIQQVLEATPPTTTGDPAQLQNVLLNLGLNARDSMPEGGKLVFATDIVTLDEEHCHQSEFDLMPGEYVRIRVIDSGTGMDAETRLRIFEPFFTTKEQGRGTGMGLASVYGSVVNHHGAIQVDSELGRGTTMAVYLPLWRAAMRENSAPTAPQDSAPGTARILLVDDEKGVRESTAKLLRRKGYKVATREDGVEAVEYYKLSWQHIDLVILDMNMPVMGGRDAFVAMRALNPGIKAILATGYSLDSESQEALDEGMLSHIQKPFRIHDLVVQIEEALQT